MTNIDLIALSWSEWKALALEPQAFARDRGVLFDVPLELLQSIAQQTLVLLGRTGATVPPWSSYLTANTDRLIVGTCGFKSPPDGQGATEIAYFTFPGSEGNGYASAMAAALVGIARRQPEVRVVCAHTMPQRNASTRILEKAGFVYVGEVMDPEDGVVWRWERPSR